MSVLSSSRSLHPIPTRFVTTALLVLSAAAWVGVTVAHSVAAGPHAHHAVPADATAVVIALSGWVLMVLAMMLPPALPLVGLLNSLLKGQMRPAIRLVAALGAFLAVWTLVGLVLVTGDAVLDLVMGHAASPRAWTLLAGIVVLVAGLYQFTPIKNACLTACRSPKWFALRLWGRRGPTLDVVAVAGAYGVSCVGCCWALMLLCLGTGAIALPVMVVLAVVMATERLIPRGRLVARAAGIVLVLLGAALVADLLPLSLTRPLLGV